MESTQDMPEIKEMDVVTFKRLFEADEAVCVDVREDVEYAAERIEGVPLLPLSRFDPEMLPDSAGKKLVLMCRSGKRSLDAASMIEDGPNEIFNLTGGILAWKENGFPTM